MGKLIEKISVSEEQEEINLLCIPYAGGGASVYYSWQKKLNPRIGLYTVQLPGRENRIMDTPYLSISDVIPDLLQEMDIVAKKPYILFGHSMGAKIAYELEKVMESSAMQVCLELIVSGSRAPNIPEPKPICHLQNEDFLKELYRFEGTPQEILQNEEMMRFLMPLLRSDFTMDEKYCDYSKKSVNCPITAFCGINDMEASEEDMKKWNIYSNFFSIEKFDGSHFFIKSDQLRVLQKINEIIDQYLN